LINLFTILLSLLVIGILVICHEFGHFIVAKASGVLVEEFAIGMGPRLIKWRRGETLYSIRLFPIGGFAAMPGEEGDADVAVPENRRFDKKPILVRSAIVAAGPIFNFALAILLFSLAFGVLGFPGHEAVIGSVEAGKPAAVAGIRPADRIVAIDGQPVNAWSDIQNLVKDKAGKSVQLTVDRGALGQVTITVTPEYDAAAGRALVGISPVVRKNWALALGAGFKETFWFLGEVVRMIVAMITGKTPFEGAGPIGLVVMVGQVARTGLINLLYFSAAISVQVGLFNLFPIPALDGSKLAFYLWEGVRGKPVDPNKQGIVNVIGFALLIALMVLVTFQDIRRLW
jgi:regulator of sigma E protease